MGEKVTSKMAVDKEELVRLQEGKDFTLRNLRKRKGQKQERDTGFLIKNMEEFGTG